MIHIFVSLLICMPLLCCASSVDERIAFTAKSIVWKKTKNTSLLKCNMVCAEMREDLCCFGYKHACCSQPAEQSVEEKAKSYLKTDALELNGRPLIQSFFHEKLYQAYGVTIKSTVHPVEGAGSVLAALCCGGRFLEYLFRFRGLTETSLLCALCVCIPTGRACSYCCLEIDGIPECRAE